MKKQHGSTESTSGSVEGRGRTDSSSSTIVLTDGAVTNELGFAVRYKSSGEVWWGLAALSNTTNLLVWIGGFMVVPFTFACYRTDHTYIAAACGGLIAFCYGPWGIWQWWQDFFYYGSLNHAKNCSINFEDDTILEHGADPTIIASHPHGCFSMGPRKMVVSPAFNKTMAHNPPISVVASILTYQPFAYFTMARIPATTCAANKYHFERLMKARKNICLQPGGFEEAMTSSTGKDRVWTAKSGFIYYALKYGYSITPMYNFGEKSGYSNFQGLWKLRAWLAKFGIATILFWGKWYCPWLPRTYGEDEGIHVVFGPPIPPPILKEAGKPSKEEVEAFRKMYEKGLVDLYDRNAHKFYAEGSYSDLEVWPRDCPELNPKKD